MFSNYPIWLKSLIKVFGFVLFFIFFVGLGRSFTVFLLTFVYQIDFDKLYEIITLPKHYDKLLVYEIGGLFFEILAVWLYPKMLGKSISLKSLGLDWKNKSKDFAFGCIIGIFLISTGFIILKIMGYVQVIKLEFNPIIFVSYIFFFLAVAISEELMARGYVLSTLMEGMNKYAALSTSAFIFAGLHLMNNHIGLIPLVNLTLAGYLLGIYFIFRKNLMFPIGLHFTWNFFQGAVFGFEVSGHDVQGIITQNVIGDILWTGGAFGLEGSIVSLPIVILGIAFIYFFYCKSNISSAESN
ncbi:CPBP family intramembrane glutamic endopeptidase [Arcicella lustrica]|uniref:CPBP family intramembrane glutamic endopeptidase n=1 Tax=Arcicella lustrica TaxID=2984196 RepID=A0ABU5SJT7_9BACT|nr:CPBP family intramembrane glutamic endopeptidase [Arcicella sp. DC25W]MEA5427515.1 CPBP family intramembrane glutamic endopeptidase [Arcicella sp. DC25W]